MRLKNVNVLWQEFYFYIYVVEEFSDILTVKFYENFHTATHSTHTYIYISTHIYHQKKFYKIILDTLHCTFSGIIFYFKMKRMLVKTHKSDFAIHKHIKPSSWKKWNIKFLLDQSYFMVKFLSEWQEYLPVKEIQMLFRPYFTVKTVDTLLQNSHCYSPPNEELSLFL